MSTAENNDGCAMVAIVLGVLLIGFVLGLTAGVKFKGEVETTRWQRTCVERGVAQYNSTTGAWEWKPEFKRGAGYDKALCPDDPRR